MKYLLDVNALVALGVLQHEFHQKSVEWVSGLASSDQSRLLTCSICELGFMRVVSHVSQYGLTLNQAKSLLLRTKMGAPVKFEFVSDGHDASHLPPWVVSARQVTDGHLLALAKANGAVLATLDQGIPNSFLIP